MKKGVTPSNYKDLVQKKLVADIFKTPDQRYKTSQKEKFNLIQKQESHLRGRKTKQCN
jgi:hypothetical protein